MRDVCQYVAITGLGIVTPAGSCLASARRMWLNGDDYLARITRFPSSGSCINWGYQIKRPDLSMIPDRKAEKVLNEKDLCAIVTMMHAMQQSGLRTAQLNPERVAMYCAAGNTQLGDLAPYFSPVKECVDPIAGAFDSRIFGKKLLDLINPLVVMRTLLNNSLCFGSRFLDARGTNSNYFDFENSGIRSIYEAFHSLRENRADLAIVTAVAPNLEPFALSELVEDGYCVPTYDDHPERGIPYDAKSRGYTPGEGAVSLTLERLDEAISRRAPVHAVIRSVSLGCDAAFPLNSKSSHASLHECWGAALELGSVNARDLGVCVGSAAGHPDLDEAEIQALHVLEKQAGLPIPMTSLKGALGETFEASNLLSIAGAIDMFNLNHTLPNMHLNVPRASVLNLRILNKPDTLLGKTALISSRGMFGSTGAVVLSDVSEALASA